MTQPLCVRHCVGRRLIQRREGATATTALRQTSSGRRGRRADAAPGGSCAAVQHRGAAHP
eukprot:349604-Chlamydomonas_euryale.AAC.1